jgi:hypothetical protein
MKNSTENTYSRLLLFKNRAVANRRWHDADYLRNVIKKLEKN